QGLVSSHKRRYVFKRFLLMMRSCLDSTTTVLLALVSHAFYFCSFALYNLNGCDRNVYRIFCMLREGYAFSRPVVLRGLTDNTKFQRLCSKSSLLEKYGSLKVRLSTANTHSYRKGRNL
ncbi:hypothetical protein GOODEAATRI_030656, partial [Goodea atripinnis]